MTSKDYLSKLPEYATSGSNSRLGYLYSSLGSSKLSNPESYAAALSWWRKTLFGLAQANKDSGYSFILRVDETLLETLTWPGVGRPLGLGIIIASLQYSYICDSMLMRILYISQI